MRDVTLSVVRSDCFVSARVVPTPGPADQGTDAQVDIGVTICLIRLPGFLRSRGRLPEWRGSYCDGAIIQYTWPCMGRSLGWAGWPRATS
jgi:hypothetical protein